MTFTTPTPTHVGRLPRSARGATPSPTARDWLGAAGAAVAALLLRLLLGELVHAPFVFFYPAVMLVALLSGPRPALLCTALSAGFGYFWVLSGLHAAAAPGTHLPELVLFTGVCIAISVVAGRQRVLLREVRDLEEEATLQKARDKARASLKPPPLVPPDGQSLSREQFKRVIDLIDHLVLVIDAEGKTVLANQAAADSMGFSRTLDLGRKHAELAKQYALFDLDGRELPMDERPSALVRKGLQIRDRLVKRTKYGTDELVYLAVSGTPLFDDSGRQALSVIISRDVTKLFVAERERDQREADFQVIFDRAPVGMAKVDAATGRFVEVNAALCSLLGYTTDELQALSWAEVTLQDELAGDCERLEAAATAHVSYEREKRYRRKDGSLVWCHMTVSPQRATDGSSSNVVVLQDITARRAAEEAQREIEARLYANLSLTVTGHAVVRAGDRRYIDCNEKFLEMIGYTREEVLGHTAAELGLHPTPEEQQRIDRQVAADGTVPLSDLRLRKKSGELGEFLIRATPVQVEGEPCIQAVFHDVTAFNRTEQARRDSEERYRALFALAPSGVVLMDEQGQFLAFNDLACEIAGCSREEFAASTLATFQPYPMVADRIEQMRAGKSVELEAKLHRRDGTLRDLLVRARMIPLGGERRVLAVWNDVTERRQSEAALRRSGERFRALIEKSTDMTVLLDGGLRTTFWSPSATVQLGWTAQDLASRGLVELVHAEDRAELESLLRLLQRKPGEAVPLSLRARHRDGSWRQLQGTCRNLLDDGVVGSLVVNARDVTAEQSLEQQLRQSQKLESVGRLAGGVAHDFNNLLTVILSCAEQLESDLRSTGSASLDDVDEVLQAGARASDLTGQLLAFSRRQVLSPQALSLDDVLTGSEKLLRRVIGEDVSLVVRTSSAPWAIFADRGQLDQILVNLAVNARDAMADGGTLTVETVAKEAGGPGPGQWVCLRVTDTGTGMTPEVQERIFEPFFTTKAVGKGTGLGLATVHGIVTQSGGAILVDSVPGRGTTFEICFPRSMAAPARPAGGPLPAALRGTETVLLIEDDAQVRGITSQALQRAGYRVLLAADGEQAVELFGAQAGGVDLVISDVVMPGMNGRSTVEQLRRTAPGLRVLFVSGYTHDVLSARGVLDTGLQFLAKPFTPNVLLARVREVLQAPVS